MVLSRDAKDVLQKYGIGINSHWNAFRAPKGHYGTHSEDFIIHLGAALKRADRDIGTQAGVIRALKNVKSEVLTGKFNHWRL